MRSGGIYSNLQRPHIRQWDSNICAASRISGICGPAHPDCAATENDLRNRPMPRFRQALLDNSAGTILNSSREINTRAHVSGTRSLRFPSPLPNELAHGIAAKNRLANEKVISISARNKLFQEQINFSLSASALPPQPQRNDSSVAPRRGGILSAEGA